MKSKTSKSIASLDGKLSLDEFDDKHSPCLETTDFDEVLSAALTRRDFLGGVVAFGSGAFVAAASAPVWAIASAGAALQFDSIAANTLDTVTVPEGFGWQVLASWGDPLWSSAPEFDHKTRGTAESQEQSLGDNNDGMEIFTKDGRILLAVNHEYVNRGVFHGNRESGNPETEDDYRKSIAGHGVAVFEIAVKNGKWQVVKDSPYNRRITADTLMTITGPGAGHRLLQTAADPSGRNSRGTWNNCGSRKTPWGTYLTCEENFNGYFSSSDENYKLSSEMKRYGIGLKDRGYGWANVDERFDISKHSNEPNRCGYAVEIDPADPDSIPKKRTALGRIKHENAEIVMAGDGRVVVYMGDDERGEFLYKFVSSRPYRQGDRDVLEDGQLYAAKFDANGRGQWLALTPATTGMPAREICIFTRIAASSVKATTMDRPEWVAAHPYKPQTYCALTNNKNRGVKPNSGGDQTPVGGPNPRAKNRYGQIVRWSPENGDHADDNFKWDLFVLAGNPSVHNDDRAGSGNINTGNMFNSPDGLGFDSLGHLWIQTDGNYSNKDDFAGHGNNQMLLGDTLTGEIRRFLVGPREAEITGLTWSPDKKTMFVGIQHPGDKGGSHFPGGGDSTPRSSIIAVQRDDGAVIG